MKRNPSTVRCTKIEACISLTRCLAGIQLHPEISHTARGTDILGNFAINICKVRAEWEMENFTEKEIIRIRKLVGENAQVVSIIHTRSRGFLLTSCRLEPSRVELIAR